VENNIPRWIAMYLSQEISSKKLSEIAKCFSLKSFRYRDFQRLGVIFYQVWLFPPACVLPKFIYFKYNVPELM